MWVNIDTRGHSKAQKNQNITVGPEDRPGKLPGSKIPGQKGLIFLPIMRVAHAGEHSAALASLAVVHLVPLPAGVPTPLGDCQTLTCGLTCNCYHLCQTPVLGPGADFVYPLTKTRKKNKRKNKLG